MKLTTPLQVKIAWFLFANGTEIANFTKDQVELIKDFSVQRWSDASSFINEMIAKYENGVFTMDDSFFETAFEEAFAGNTDMIARMDECGGEDFGMELVRACVENPDMVRRVITQNCPEEDVQQMGIPDDHEVGAKAASSDTPRHMLPESLWDEIWSYSRGEGELIIVLDTGSVDHEDLSQPQFRLSRVPGEPSGLDTNFHGTHCAGTAIGQNRIGVAPGADWGSIQCLSGRGAGQDNWIAGAIDDAVEMAEKLGKKAIISMSIGGKGYSQITVDAINRANAKGHIIVAAAGNSGMNRGDNVDNPGGYDGTACISSYDDRTEQGSPFTSTGPAVNFCFPGSDIVSADYRGGRSNSSGTSMATPGAAGAIALIQSFLTRNGYARLKDTYAVIDFCASISRDIGAPGKDWVFGTGILEILKTLKSMDPSDVTQLAIRSNETSLSA